MQKLLKFTNRNTFNHLTLIGSIKDRLMSILAKRTDWCIEEKKKQEVGCD